MTIELLSPAGNLEKLKIAVLYGASAVYVSGGQFGLRSAADNFSSSDLAEAVKFAHARGRKVYVTLNAFLHDQELERLPAFLAILSQIGPDAVICSDLGVVESVRQFTTLPIHVSTQASVLNVYHALVWKELGVKRVVVGRELSILEAAEIKRKTNLEIEMFVHGAMCMAVSGRCSISTYVALRDSNRGGCIQNCRFKYRLYPEGRAPIDAYPLNSKDLCGMRVLKRFVDCGIDSIKIEGRMKSNLYIATTTRCYARALSELKSTGDYREKYWSGELTKIPHRDYTEGSLISPAGPDSVYNQTSRAASGYKMAGTVLEVDRDNRRFVFYAKNKLNVGDTIEIMTFGGEIITLKLRRLINLVGREMRMVQPENAFWIPWKKGIEPQNVGRVRR